MLSSHAFAPALLSTLITLLSPFSHAHPIHNNGSIVWGACPEPFTAPNLQCANYTVPLDWKNPGGETINIGMAKIPANDTAHRIGSLFVNPGGPGGSGVNLGFRMATGVFSVEPDIFNRFDIIAVDPRGIGLSTPLECDPEVFNERVSIFPTSEAEYEALVDKNTRAGLSCREKSGRLIDFLDTTSVARDFEAVRIALGAEPMNWLGLSYGTQIGSQYAELFPKNIRTMALDGVVQRASESSNLLIESTAYEASLGRFADWCSSNTTCALNGQDALEVFDSTVAAAEASPIPAPGCDDISCRTTVWPEDILLNFQGLLLRTSNRPLAAQALAEASRGNATLLSSPLLSDPFMPTFNSYTALATECQDWTHATKSFGELSDKIAAGRIFAPHTRGASQSYTIQTQCIGWPAALTNPPHAIHVDESAPTILLINAYYDPSTSYVWATGLRDEIGDAVLLSRNGDGHTSYGLRGETTRAINRFLIEEVLPKAGTVLDT